MGLALLCAAAGPEDAPASCKHCFLRRAAPEDTRGALFWCTYCGDKDSYTLGKLGPMRGPPAAAARQLEQACRARRRVAAPRRHAESTIAAPPGPAGPWRGDRIPCECAKAGWRKKRRAGTAQGVGTASHRARRPREHAAAAQPNKFIWPALFAAAAAAALVLACVVLPRLSGAPSVVVPLLCCCLLCSSPGLVAAHRCESRPPRAQALARARATGAPSRGSRPRPGRRCWAARRQGGSRGWLRPRPPPPPAPGGRGRAPRLSCRRHRRHRRRRRA
jgi:hypothetical protein